MLSVVESPAEGRADGRERVSFTEGSMTAIIRATFAIGAPLCVVLAVWASRSSFLQFERIGWIIPVVLYAIALFNVYMAMDGYRWLIDESDKHK